MTPRRACDRVRCLRFEESGTANSFVCHLRDHDLGCGGLSSSGPRAVRQNAAETIFTIVLDAQSANGVVSSHKPEERFGEKGQVSPPDVCSACSVFLCSAPPTPAVFRVPPRQDPKLSVFRVPCSVFRVPCSVFRVPFSVFRVPCSTPDPPSLCVLAATESCSDMPARSSKSSSKKPTLHPWIVGIPTR
jgi:hypothetical protein